jgi:hypothetical protein
MNSECVPLHCQIENTFSIRRTVATKYNGIKYMAFGLVRHNKHGRCKPMKTASELCGVQPAVQNAQQAEYW